jgi:hypothetical protein
MVDLVLLPNSSINELWTVIREDLNWTEKMLLRALLEAKQHELDSLDSEIKAAQRRVHLDAGVHNFFFVDLLKVHMPFHA